MTVFNRVWNWGLPAIACLLLCGCLGGSVAQQLASSLAMHAADRITASAIENYENKTEAERRNGVLQDTSPDPYWAAFVTSGFNQVIPITEAPPQSALQPASQPQIKQEKFKATPLVRVEIWNQLVGEEKLAFLEKARLQGATNLPPKQEWHRWQVATGAVASDKDKLLLFLIPPDFGRIASGELAVVEMFEAGEVSYARYALN